MKLGIRISKSQEIGTRESSQRKRTSLDALSRTTRGNKHPVTTPELSDVDVSAEAKGILGPHKTFASFTSDKFNQHMRAGEMYLKQGRYYRAADAYTPEYARFKIDLVAMVGDRDKLESRIVDVKQWLQISDAPELQFLLGYVYYQMGRLQRAKEAIDAAYEKLPDSPAVIALKKAIDSAVAGKQPEIK